MGFGIVKEGKEEELLYSGYIIWEEKHLSLRRKQALNFMNDLIERYHVTEVVIERVRLFHFGKINFSPISSLLQLTAILTDFIREGVSISDIDTRSYRKALLGTAKCEKSDIKNYINNKYAKNIEILDEAEAIGIALAGLRSPKKAKKLN